MWYFWLILGNIMLYQQSGFAHNHTIGRRIIDGQEVNIDAYPHAVFLYLRKTSPSACGSSLITSRIVVTAARCFEELQVVGGKMTAYLGAEVPRDARVIRKIKKYKIHPKYEPEKGKYNIGLGLLNPSVTMGHGIQVIPIARKLPQYGDLLFTSGWGKDGHKKFHTDYSDSRHLKESKQTLISHRECAVIMYKTIGSSYWCTIAAKGYHYHGDNGNGLVTRDSELVGVVSLRIDDATVYSDLTKERTWIADATVLLTDQGC